MRYQSQVVVRFPLWCQQNLIILFGTRKNLHSMGGIYYFIKLTIVII
jgi:hypothetical protein